MKSRALAALLLLSGAHALAAQRTSQGTVLRSDTRATIERIIDSARVAGIPAEPLRDKVLEGVLKGADDQRIVYAVQSLSRELASARAVLGGASNLALMSATASALHAGVPATELTRLVRTSAEPANASVLASALVVLVDIVTKRVPTNVAITAIGDLLQRGAQERQFVELRNEVELDIAAGRTPEAAMLDRTRAQLRALPERAVIERQLPSRTPPHDVPMFESITATPVT